MKEQKKPRTIQIPEWMDSAIADLAFKHRRSISGEIQFLVEEALKNNAVSQVYTNSLPISTGEAGPVMGPDAPLFNGTGPIPGPAA
jgi:hypothetical protein